MYNSKYYTCEQIDQRLLEGYYDDAVAAGYTGSKAQYLAGLLKAINYSANPTLTADKVVYNQAISGLTSKNVQGAIDELAAKNATKAEKAEVTAELEKKFDKESILQESGDAEYKVMSQKAVSDKLSELASTIWNSFSLETTKTQGWKNVKDVSDFFSIPNNVDLYLYLSPFTSFITDEGQIMYSENVDRYITVKLSKPASRFRLQNIAGHEGESMTIRLSLADNFINVDTISKSLINGCYLDLKMPMYEKKGIRGNGEEYWTWNGLLSYPIRFGTNKVYTINIKTSEQYFIAVSTFDSNMNFIERVQVVDGNILNTKLKNIEDVCFIKIGLSVDGFYFLNARELLDKFDSISVVSKETDAIIDIECTDRYSVNVNSLKNGEIYVMKMITDSDSLQKVNIYYYDYNQSSLDNYKNYPTYANITKYEPISIRFLKTKELSILRFTSNSPYRVKIYREEDFDKINDYKPSSLPYFPNSIQISRNTESYCHDSFVINHGKYCYVFYQSSERRSYESNDVNTIYCVKVDKGNTNSPLKRSIIISDLLKVDKINNKNVYGYNFRAVHNIDNNKIPIWISLDDDSDNYMGMRYIDIDSMEVSNLEFMMLENKVFSMTNYISKLNELGFSIPRITEVKTELEIVGIDYYNGNYYMITCLNQSPTREADRTGLSNFVLYKSSNFKNWEIIKVLDISNFKSSEVSIVANDNKIYVAVRSHNDGVWYFVIDMEGNILKSPTKIDTNSSKPCIISFREKIIILYNINTNAGGYYNRVKLGIGEINKTSYEFKNLSSITNMRGVQYFDAFVFDSNRIMFTNTEDVRGLNYTFAGPYTSCSLSEIQLFEL